MARNLERALLTATLLGAGCKQPPAPIPIASSVTAVAAQAAPKKSVFDPSKYPDTGKQYNPADFKEPAFYWDYKVLVLPGDNLVKVSEEIYGTYKEWKNIRAASQDYEFLPGKFNPRTDLHPGQWLLTDMPHNQAIAFAKAHPERHVSYGSHGPNDPHF